MGSRRFAPLIVLVLLGAFVLMARLFTVQVLQGGVWTAQADALTRNGTIEPYTRGEIVDARGLVLARDIESYQIQADYRDFRRGNALGVVAHARSALEMRPVPLAEARQDLERWAVALGELSPEVLERFARGAALECAGLRIPKTSTPEDDSRVGRAVDLGFYATALFDLQPRERSRLKYAENEQRALAFVDWLAADRKLPREELEQQLRDRCKQDLRFLADFGALSANDDALAGEDQSARLLEQLERWRGQVEDGAASDLFEAAAGFRAGRLEAGALYEFFDLDWIRRSLRWDEARLQAWTQAARSAWLESRDGQRLDFVVERTRRDMPRPRDTSATPATSFASDASVASDVSVAPELSAASATQLVLREVALLFVAPARGVRGVQAAEKAWYEHGRAQVFGELDSLFDVDVPSELAADPDLPIFDPAFIDEVAQAPTEVSPLARLEFWRDDGTSADPALIEDAAVAWGARFKGKRDRAALRRGFEALFARLEDGFQSELRERLSRVRALALESGDASVRGKLELSAARRDRADEKVRYILKDRGSRQFVAVARPSYELVNLLTRYPHYLRGFEVVRVHTRVNPTQSASGGPAARLLVGRVAPPDVVRRLSQVEIERNIADLEAQPGLDEADMLNLAELRTSLDRPDEQVGAFGLESWFEAELAGRNGSRVERGLSERDSGVRERPAVAKIDGVRITTTLDATLQQEAEYCLEHPEGDQHESGKSDQNWLANPSGAIVLLSPDGDVIVAASWPLVERPNEAGRSPICDDVRERTLSKPDFQPPGSVFKPFVAAYALDRLGLDPGTVRECSAAMNPGGHGPGYGGVHCHETTTGHGQVNLNSALKVSCNSYFAWLGEQYDQQSLQAMAREFGFGEPTGVRAMANATRSGLHEDVVEKLFAVGNFKGRSLCEAGNGLSVVEATPMQVARATAGLATGVLPSVRLVSRIDKRDLLREARPLTLSKAALDIVRAAMLDVANDSKGSAYHALSQAQLGFRMAAKTGSADVDSKPVDGDRVLKHTWVSGWFPAENPVGILVVFEHHTTRTSTHGAVWLARQFLLRPVVQAWIAEKVAGR